MSAADAVATAAAGAAPAVPADAPDAEEDATLGLPAEQVAKYTVATTFRGAAVELLQVPRARGDDGADITGWAAWEASNVLLRWVADDGHLRRALGGGGDGDGTRDAPPPCPPWSSLSVLDLSAGAGLVALAAAAAGARAVAACDIHPQLPQLVGNLRRGDLAVDEVVTPTPLGGAAPAKPPSVRRWAPIRRGDSSSGNDGRRPSAAPAVRVVPFWWGQPLDALRPPLQDDGGATPEEAERLWYDVVLVSDILFIALRDKLGDMLAHTIRGLAARCRCLLFVYEERLCDEEQAWMEALGLPPKTAREHVDTAASAAAASSSSSSAAASIDLSPPTQSPLNVEEVAPGEIALTFDDSLQGAGGHPDSDELWHPSLFWSPPPVRLFVVRGAQARARRA